MEATTAINRFRILKAAILTKFNEPLEVMDSVDLNCRLSYGQVLVSVIASGICGAQLAEIRGDKNPEAPLPRLMGHEAVVRVMNAGSEVSKLKEGQKCIAHWRKGDGIECDFPQWTLPVKGNQPIRQQFSAGKITTFSTHSIISENRLTPVPEDTPDELCCLLGCSLSTALGVIENEADVKFGESVLIIGCGGLGLNLILAAKLRQAGLIVAIEKNSEKRKLAWKMGASQFFTLDGEVSDSELANSQFDVVIDTTGDPDRISHGIDLLRGGGRFVMVGQPGPGKDVVIPNAKRMFDGAGKTIMATQGGRFSPSTDIPRYIAMWRAGRLNLDGLISHRLPLSKINEGLDLVRAGQAGRILIDCASE